MFFAANAPRAADEAGRVYAARFMPNSVALTAAYPLFIAITLKVNTDQGMYDIPVQTDTSAGLACLPTLDGQAVGAALALSTDAASLGRAVGSMGRNPDTLWSILRSSPVTATGRHEVALACGAGATFHFRGVAMLTVLQQIPGN
jgi:hypothetical protein